MSTEYYFCLICQLNSILDLNILRVTKFTLWPLTVGYIAKNSILTHVSKKFNTFWIISYSVQLLISCNLVGPPGKSCLPLVSARWHMYLPEFRIWYLKNAAVAMTMYMYNPCIFSIFQIDIELRWCYNLQNYIWFLMKMKYLEVICTCIWQKVDLLT